MENSADALKIALAIFVFVLAITITFSVISQAKSTADYVLYYSDKTNFYDHSSSSSQNRTVSVAEVISSLYRYKEESMSVTVKLGSSEYVFDIGRETVGVEEFVKNNLLTLDNNTMFIEEFAEVPIGGMYKTGEDGTVLTLTSGSNKIYITYIKQ